MTHEPSDCDCASCLSADVAALRVTVEALRKEVADLRDATADALSAVRVRVTDLQNEIATLRPLAVTVGTSAPTPAQAAAAVSGALAGAELASAKRSRMRASLGENVCGAEHARGFVCALPVGHEGHHEQTDTANDRYGPAQWIDRTAAIVRVAKPERCLQCGYGKAVAGYSGRCIACAAGGDR